MFFLHLMTPQIYLTTRWNGPEPTWRTISVETRLRLFIIHLEYFVMLLEKHMKLSALRYIYEVSDKCCHIYNDSCLFSGLPQCGRTLILSGVKSTRCTSRWGSTHSPFMSWMRTRLGKAKAVSKLFHIQPLLLLCNDLWSIKPPVFA